MIKFGAQGFESKSRYTVSSNGARAIARIFSALARNAGLLPFNSNPTAAASFLQSLAGMLGEDAAPEYQACFDDRALTYSGGVDISISAR